MCPRQRRTLRAKVLHPSLRCPSAASFRAVNNVTAVSFRRMYWRSDATQLIDHVFMQTFFGGNSLRWASPAALPRTHPACACLLPRLLATAQPGPDARPQWLPTQRTQLPALLSAPSPPPQVGPRDPAKGAVPEVHADHLSVSSTAGCRQLRMSNESTVMLQTRRAAILAAFFLISPDSVCPLPSSFWQSFRVFASLSAHKRSAIKGYR